MLPADFACWCVLEKKKRKELGLSRVGGSYQKLVEEEEGLGGGRGEDGQRFVH